MPWVIRKRDGKYAVYREGERGEPVGDALGTHETEDEARAQQRALYAAENAKVGAVKFSNPEATEIEGLLAPYGGPFSGRDIAGEFFSPKTDFVLDWFKDGARPLLFQHGLDPQTGVSVVGRIKALSRDDAGLWMRAQLDLAHDYYAAIKELIEAGKLGLSSGSMRHLVDVDRRSGEIKRWPLIEGSLTPTPANPLAEVEFATVKAHLEAIGSAVPADLTPPSDPGATKTLTTDSLPSLADEPNGKVVEPDPTPVKMNPERKRKMMAEMAADMGMKLSDDEMADMMAEMSMPDDMSEPEAREMTRKRLQQHKDEHGGDPQDGQKLGHEHHKSASEVKAVAGSYEELIEKLNCLVQPRDPLGVPSGSTTWCYVVATYPDYFIAKRCGHGCEDMFLRASYTLDPEGHPVVGAIEEVEETFVPVAAQPTNPIVSYAESAVRFAALFAGCTQDLRERRLKEGRVISGLNRSRIRACLDAMETAMSELHDLYNITTPAAEAKADAMAPWRELAEGYRAQVECGAL